MMQRFGREMERLVGTPGQYRYLLAVSGGADSCVMALLFREAGLDFAIAHCNFHLRGADSDRDMELVRALAQQWDVPLFIEEFDTLALQQGSGLSVEMMARQLRYDWFAKIGEDYDFIVTAHHANDAAETVLLNLCRGTGLKGLTAIPARNGRIIRPMLAFTAREIRDYAAAHQLAYAVDCTNADVTIPRNRVRHKVIPELEQINPALLDTFAKNRTIFQKQYHFYQKHIENCKKQCLSCTKDGYVLKKNLLESDPDRELLLYEILKDFGFPYAIVEQLGRNFQSGRQYFSPTHTLVVNRDEYLIQPHREEVDTEEVFQDLDALRCRFRVECATWGPGSRFGTDNHTLYIPAEKLRFPLVLRHWREGDAFYPLGARGRQKVSDFFTDHKIDRFAKQRVQLLCHGDDILWLVGLRSSEKFKIDSQTTQYYIITDYGNI